MASTRKQKMVRVLRDELSRIIREEMNDPRLGLVSITDIELTPDLRVAQIYFSVYGTPEEQQESMAALDRASRFLRGELSRQLDMRHTPELHFHLDRSLERGAHVFELISKLETPKKKDETDGTE
ncbi:MAG: 30S ribosome-binding factor RbfA [Armatimonadota bacterium]